MQLVEILSYSNKIKTVDDLLNHFDLIIELARDDILKITKSKRLLFSDFDFTFGEAIKILINQLQKKYLKGVQRFLRCQNIENAIKWIITRIIANMRNIGTTTDNRYKLHCTPSFGPLHNNITLNNFYDELIELIELEKLDRNILKKGLQTLWKNSIYEDDFDYYDMEYLCNKYGIEITEIIETEAICLQKYKIEQAENSYFQLVIVF